MATRKKPTASKTAQPGVTLDSMVQFLGLNQDKDHDTLRKAVDLATAAAAAHIGQELPEELPHPIAQGVRLLATKLLITGALEGPVEAKDIPLLVRAFWTPADAAGQ
jgi:hypothetical protein